MFIEGLKQFEQKKKNNKKQKQSQLQQFVARISNVNELLLVQWNESFRFSEYIITDRVLIKG